MGVPNFNEAEYAFMKEEMQVLTPLAQGLDRLQGDANPESYRPMAFLYPTLLQLRHNYYTELANSQVGLLKYCSPLVSVILADINIGGLKTITRLLTQHGQQHWHPSHIPPSSCGGLLPML